MKKPSPLFLRKPLIIFALCSLLFAFSVTLFAQTATGDSIIEKMKAAIHNFTLAGELNPGITGLQSSPVTGKKTGDMLTAGEYNRILELVGQGGGGADTIELLASHVLVFDSGVSTVDKPNTQLDLSTKMTIPANAKAVIVTAYCANYTTQNENTTLYFNNTNGCSSNGMLSTNDVDLNNVIVPFYTEKSIYYSYIIPKTEQGGHVKIYVTGFIIGNTGGGGGGGGLASDDLTCPDGQYVTGLKPDGSVKCKILAGAPMSTLTTFSTPGNGTFTVPAGINRLHVRMVGGGGGAAGANAQYAGGGGGAGGYCEGYFAVTPGAVIPLSVGASGAGSGSTNAQPGGTSFFGTLCKATGGVGGAFANAPPYSAGGDGGVGSGGQINLLGGFGGDGRREIPAANGGASAFGGGIRSGTDFSVPYHAAPGAGGGSAYLGGNGQSGMPGLIIIQY